jgi:hypothetical protein
MGTRCLAVIIWKFIIQHFYSLETTTAPTNTAFIWAKSLRRFAELCLRHKASSRLIIAHISDRGKPPPEAKKFNVAVAPLARLNDAFQLRWSDALHEELSRQELERYIKYGRYGPAGGASA